MLFVYVMFLSLGGWSGFGFMLVSVLGEETAKVCAVEIVVVEEVVAT